MKRSEMVDLIQRHLMVYFDILDVDNRGASSLLKVMQDAGMLAPLGTFKDPGHFECDDFEYQAYDWENEEDDSLLFSIDLETYKDWKGRNNK